MDLARRQCAETPPVPGMPRLDRFDAFPAAGVSIETSAASDWEGLHASGPGGTPKTRSHAPLPLTEFRSKHAKCLEAMRTVAAVANNQRTSGGPTRPPFAVDGDSMVVSMD